jgi:hypothetical protein
MASQGRFRKTLRCWAFWVEPPIGIEPMTYALRGRFRPSSVVHQFTPTLLIDVLRSGHVQNHPGVLLAHPLARPPVGAGRPAPPSGATSSALRTPRSRLGLRSPSRGEPQVNAEASETVSVPRAELDALKAELKRLRREVGRDVARRRIQADPGPGDDAPVLNREELAEAWGIRE